MLTAEDIRAGRFRKGSLSAISEDRWLGDSLDGNDDDADYTNHSCDPNLWMGDEATLIARRDISAGEELTADYVMWEANQDFQAGWECHCGSPVGRETITGKDWRLAELQERYRDHFSPLLNERIERLKALLKRST